MRSLEVLFRITVWTNSVIKNILYVYVFGV